MRVYILGPVTTNTYYGGVAVFDEGLADGFRIIGHQVTLLTNQKNAPDATNEGIEIKKINYSSISKLLKKDKPDYIITELAYAKYLFGLKNVGIRVYYLHGFFNQGFYGVIKAKLAVMYQKLLLKNCDITFANSHFTAMVNQDFFGIHTDRVFHVGVKQNFIDKVKINKTVKEENSVLFAARLVEAKRGMVFLKAIRELVKQNVSIHAYIAGDGNEFLTLKKYVEENDLPVTMLGRLSLDELMDYYCRSEVFVSLDPSEPFGIVFAEALICGCKIVSPYTGGQNEIVDTNPLTRSCVDVTRTEDVAEGIARMLSKGKYPHMSEEQINYFSYVRLANEITDFWNNMNTPIE